MIPVYVWELSRRKMFTLWWTIGVAGLVALTILAYSSFGSDAQQLDETFSGLSDSAGMFFGGTDFFSPVGYLSSQIYYITLPLLVIIAGVTLVSSLTKTDEDDLTVELTLARPISRGQLLLAKAAAGATIMLVLTVVSYVVTVLSVQAVDLTIDQGDLLVTHLLSFAFSVSFAAIGFMLTTMSRLTRRLSMVVVMLLSFGGYIVSSLAGFWDQLELLVKFMPYHYYDTAALLGGMVDSGLIVYLIGTFVVAVTASYVGYSRRDIG